MGVGVGVGAGVGVGVGVGFGAGVGAGISSEGVDGGVVSTSCSKGTGSFVVGEG